MRGRVLGWVHSWTGDGSNQFDIVVDGVGGLEQLFRLPDESILEVGDDSMSYEYFRKSVLDATRRIFLSQEQYTSERFPVAS